MMDASAANPVLALVSGMVPTPAAAASLQHLPDVQGCDVLLCGSASSFRASLALHFALHHAARTRLPALFLCRQDGLEQNVPLLPHYHDGDDPGLHLLQIKYANSPADLQRFASCLHLLPGAYSALVVEDINSVFRPDDRNALVRTLALLLEGVRAYRVASGCGSRFQLLVTDSSDEARRPRYIYDRWLSTAVLLSPSAPPAGPDGSFILTLAPPSASGQYGGAAGRPSAVPYPSDASEASAASSRPGIRCWYRPSGGRLVLEAVHGADRLEGRVLPHNGGPASGAAMRGGAVAATGSQGALAFC